MDAIGIATAGGSIGARGAMTGESIAASGAMSGGPIGRHDRIGQRDPSDRIGPSARRRDRTARTGRNGRNVLPDPIGRKESSARHNRIEGDDP
jgi:hypothetical protein